MTPEVVANILGTRVTSHDLSGFTSWSLSRGIMETAGLQSPVAECAVPELPFSLSAFPAPGVVPSSWPPPLPCPT